MEDFDILKALKNMAKSAIRLTINAKGGVPVGRFGGRPDVPENFVWPTFLPDTLNDNKIKPRPLSFLAQFDCELLAPLDTEHLLPKQGFLAFFYELNSQTWGFSPEDAGSARVFYFPEKTALKERDFPADLKEDYRLPPIKFYARTEIQYPDFEDFQCAFLKIYNPNYWQEIPEEFDKFYDEYDLAIETLCGKDNEFRHQLLGWPSIIQQSMPVECELVGRGYFMGGPLKDIPAQAISEALENSLANWLLLFQLESDEFDDYCLDFGDCGSIYFYIRKKDLKERLFERAWLIAQCY